MAAWISETLRVTSASGNAGVSTTSDARSSPSAMSFFCALVDTESVSRPAPASTLPPTNSMAERSPARQYRPRQVREPRLVRGIVDRSRAHQDTNGHDRDGRPLRDEQDDPIRQDLAVRERRGG